MSERQSLLRDFAPWNQREKTAYQQPEAQEKEQDLAKHQLRRNPVHILLEQSQLMPQQFIGNLDSGIGGGISTQKQPVRIPSLVLQNRQKN